MELVCPAGNAAMIRSAVNRGADTVYIGLKDEASARHFSGPSFNDWQARESLRYQKDQNVEVTPGSGHVDNLTA
jgi:putative protease